MQDYLDLAQKNGITLKDSGPCQFCGAATTRGIHECVEIFSLGFQMIDYGNPENHLYRFLAVDAHTLQHPEIHGRWNNHFHHSRQHLMFHYKVKWQYQLSPKLSDCLNIYKANKEDEYLTPPPIGNRGSITTSDVQQSKDEECCKTAIKNWGLNVYQAWSNHHHIVDQIAQDFLKLNAQYK